MFTKLEENVIKKYMEAIMLLKESSTLINEMYKKNMYDEEINKKIDSLLDKCEKFSKEMLNVRNPS